MNALFTALWRTPLLKSPGTVLRPKEGPRTCRLSDNPSPRPTLTNNRATMPLDRILATAAKINADPLTYPYAVKHLLVFG